MAQTPAKSVSCEECERLIERITQLEKKIESLQQIRESEQFIDSVAASMHLAEPANANGQTQTFNTSSVEHPDMDLADTLPWICPNTTGYSAPKPAPPNDASHWHRIGARPKASTPARTWSDVVGHRGKSGTKPVWRGPTLTPPPELPLQNRYDALTVLEMCENNNYAEPKEENHTAHHPKAVKNLKNKRNSPKTTAGPRARGHIANPKHDRPDTVLIGDAITKHVRMPKTENLTLENTSVRELIEVLPGILSRHPNNRRIIIHAGSFDILRKKTGSEILKQDFSRLLGSLNQYNLQHVFISGPIPTLGRGIESFSRLLGLNTWLASVCTTHGINFIDNFNIFWNCKDRFRPDGVNPNITGCRLLGANLRHALGKLYQNMVISAKDITPAAPGETACPSPPSSPSADPLLHITQGLRRMSLSQSGTQRHSSPPPSQPPVKQLLKDATLKLSQLDELLNSDELRHHHSSVHQR